MGVAPAPADDVGVGDRLHECGSSQRLRQKPLGRTALVESQPRKPSDVEARADQEDKNGQTSVNFLALKFDTLLQDLERAQTENTAWRKKLQKLEKKKRAEQEANEVYAGECATALSLLTAERDALQRQVDLLHVVPVPPSSEASCTKICGRGDDGKNKQSFGDEVEDFCESTQTRADVDQKAKARNAALSKKPSVELVPADSSCRSSLVSLPAGRTAAAAGGAGRSEASELRQLNARLEQELLFAREELQAAKKRVHAVEDSLDSAKAAQSRVVDEKQTLKLELRAHLKSNAELRGFLESEKKARGKVQRQFSGLKERMDRLRQAKKCAEGLSGALSRELEKRGNWEQDAAALREELADIRVQLDEERGRKLVALREAGELRMLVEGKTQELAAMRRKEAERCREAEKEAAEKERLEEEVLMRKRKEEAAEKLRSRKEAAEQDEIGMRDHWKGGGGNVAEMLKASGREMPGQELVVTLREEAEQLRAALGHAEWQRDELENQLRAAERVAARDTARSGALTKRVTQLEDEVAKATEAATEASRKTEAYRRRAEAAVLQHRKLKDEVRALKSTLQALSADRALRYPSQNYPPSRSPLNVGGYKVDHKVDRVDLGDVEADESASVTMLSEMSSSSPRRAVQPSPCPHVGESEDDEDDCFGNDPALRKLSQSIGLLEQYLPGSAGRSRRPDDAGKQKEQPQSIKLEEANRGGGSGSSGSKVTGPRVDGSVLFGDVVSTPSAAPPAVPSEAAGGGAAEAPAAEGARTTAAEAPAAEGAGTTAGMKGETRDEDNIAQIAIDSL